MESSQQALILRRNKKYFAGIPRLTKDEINARAAVCTAIEIELIKLLNYMEAEYRQSLDDFINNYGNFSDGLNRIYNIADDRALGESRSPFAQRFSELQRSSWNMLLPVTLRRLRLYEIAEETAILWLFSASRAERAARSTTNSLYSCQKFEQLKQQGYKYKQWHTIMDGRERDTHAIANGQTVPIDQPFIVGGFRMMFPRDMTYGAPLREIINCRCSITGR